MLKMNSKIAKENIKNYIIESINDEYLQECGYREGAAGVYDAFMREKVDPYEVKRCNGNYRTMFKDWLEGLPSAFAFEPGWYQAAQIVGAWLEEAPEEIDKYYDKDETRAYEIYKNTITNFIFDNK